MKTLLTLLGLALTTLTATAQTPTAPALAFNLVDGATVHKSAGSVAVRVVAGDPSGLRSVSLSGGYAGGTAQPYGAKSATSTLTFYCSYFPTGDYVFSASATDTIGYSSKKSIVLHLVD